MAVLSRARLSQARKLLAGTAVVAITAIAGAGTLIANSDKERTLNLFNIHNKETLTLVYKRDGKYIPEALEKLNWIFRDWRLNEATKMDPAAFDLLWEIHTELGSREPIHIISGYRSRKSNELLRKTVGGQASESRHILGKAMDVHFPDISPKQVRYSALIRERGGVGYYPTSAIPFIHIDTDRVRHWPRLPRMELALLFPNGNTQHQPAEGGALTRDDVSTAKAKFPKLATEVAEFLDLRSKPRATLVASAAPIAPSAPPAAAQPVVTAKSPAPAKPAAPPFAMASLTPPPPAAAEPVAPRLVTEPRLVDRPSRLTTRPTDAERGKLAQLAALASSEPVLVTGPAPAARPRLPSLTGNDATGKLPPAVAATAAPAAEPRLASLGPAKADSISDAGSKFGWGGWAQAPAFDEEHPDELSYRPFPLAPYMTETASADDPALTRMVHPDVAKTLELLDQAGSMPPMKLRPGAQVAQLMWALQFKGGMASIDDLFASGADLTKPAAKGQISDRKVKTAAE
jgi:uncharacterized protein YcbK (DUF882 family)